MSATLDKLRPYICHGADFRPPKPTDKEAVSVCPFCQSIFEGVTKNPKFSVNLTTGQFRCWHCKRVGNTYTFLSQLHEYWLEQTDLTAYNDLAANRLGIRAEDFRSHKFALNRESGRWLIPNYGRRDNLINLRTYEVNGKHPYATTGIPLNLYRLNHLRGTGPLMVGEGDWDPIALERLRIAAKQKTVSILGTPGSSVFKKDWTGYFAARDVYLCYDNDNAGQEGTELAIAHLGNVPSSIHRLDWPSTTSDGWDLRDMVHLELDQSRHKPAAVWADLFRLFKPVRAAQVVSPGFSPENPPEAEEPRVRVRTFKALANHFAEHIHMDANTTDGLALLMAVTLSIQLPSDPLWVLIVGAPGSGKTLALKALSRVDHTIYRSAIRAKELISGWWTEDGSDPSLLAVLPGKVLVLKDYTEILAMDASEQEALYGVLRGAYDGRAERHFANGLSRVYEDCYFAMIAGVTDEIKSHNRAALGERFLRFQWVEGRGYDQTAHIIAAIHGMADQLETEQFLSRIVASFLSNFDISPETVPKPEPWFIQRIIALVQIVAHLRANVSTNFHGELMYRPTPEIGTRLAKQLVKLAQCLAVVLGKSRITRDVYGIVEKVAFDTCQGWSQDIFRCLLNHDSEPVSKDQIEQEADLPSSTCQRRLEAMLTLGTVQRSPLNTFAGTLLNTRGRPGYGWTLSDELAELVRQSKMEG